ncbi:ATP-binding cassette domain-containing protein [Microaceticoccus formicicus]|uniref:ATP-binding cassette domain-containing protein n=1 Tax=Microaceticoccus formicicus TaxID=3118105 RepID=UPI003CD0469C|nr:ATP-binding cassette domain-containing protein [Peptoniphilaceae bacterium AMB_02]
MDAKPIIKIKKLNKTYANGVRANIDIDLNLYPGEIHALIGENGAGKTTIMKILSGLLDYDSGSIEMVNEGEAKASNHVGYSPQEPHLIDELKVFENIALGFEFSSIFSFFDRNKTKSEISKISEMYKIHMNLDTESSKLNMSEKQKAIILKLLYQNNDILIFDEPTTILNIEEKDEFFKILKRLKESGKSIVIISHDLEEMVEISDRITIMSKGKVIGSFYHDKPELKEIERMISGDYLDFVKSEKDKEITRTRFEICDGELIEIDGINCLEIGRGEIFGIAEIENAVSEKLIGRIMGFERNKGQIILDGENISNYSTIKRRNAGISYIPRDRINEGAALTLSISENLINPEMTSESILNKVKLEQNAAKCIKKYRIECKDKNATAGSLSGGNLQKLIMAREFSVNPKLIIAHEPERGLDIASVYNLKNLLKEKAESGSATILISSEMDTLVEICDRIGIVIDGMIREVKKTRDTTASEIAVKLIGGKSGKA